MISVQNHLRLLSGNKKYIYIILCSLAMQSCGIFGGGKKGPTPPPPVVIHDKDDSQPKVKKPTSVDPIESKPVDVNIPTEPLDTIKKNIPVTIKEQVNLAIILPFELDKTDATGQLSKAAKNSLNLYKGIKFALAEQNYFNKDVNVYVFDNEGSASKTQQIISSQPFPDVQMVIGPLYTKNLSAISNYAKSKKIPFISPLSSSENLAKNNEYIISANATKGTRYETLFKFVKKEFINPNVSVVYQPSNRDIHIKDELVKIGKANQLDVQEQVSEGQEMFSAVTKVLEKGRENVIILPTDDKPGGVTYVKTMLNYLNTIGTEYKIAVAGISEWNGVKEFNPNDYGNLNLLILDRYFVNETNVVTNNKMNTLKAKNNGVSLHIYTLQGYDLMSYLAELIGVYGKEFPKHLSQQYNGLQTSYQFDELNKNGQKLFIDNKTINILRFQNGMWVKVN